MVAILGKRKRQLLIFMQNHWEKSSWGRFTFRHYLTGCTIFYVAVPF